MVTWSSYYHCCSLCPLFFSFSFFLVLFILIFVIIIAIAIAIIIINIIIILNDDIIIIIIFFFIQTLSPTMSPWMCPGTAQSSIPQLQAGCQAKKRGAGAATLPACPSHHSTQWMAQQNLICQHFCHGSSWHSTSTSIYNVRKLLKHYYRQGQDNITIFLFCNKNQLPF